jgi:hypothetical protein
MTTTSPSDHGLPARAVERFWKRVTKTDACWTHGGSVASHGYPQATLRGRSQPAHRVSWMIHHGPIPAGTMVLHRCNNKLCVHPDHLYLGDHRQNMDDVCRAGHPSRKLTEADVGRVRSSRDTNRALAESMGVNQRVIHQIRSGRTYRYVATDASHGGAS